jgi:hypothetical protein
MKQICRSQSVPTSVRRFNGSSRRVGPDAGFRVLVSDDAEQAEDIAAEEAVCRICMVALSEEEDALLKLECCCKGELALAHRGCAIKWFSIKGNGTCDVCSQEVRNLPVTLHTGRHPSSSTATQQQAVPTTSPPYIRVLHGTPILAIISMLAYFCFLEQLLVHLLLYSILIPHLKLIYFNNAPQVGDHGTAALAISLPFACVLGLFSSLTTTKMVSRRYVWIYSAVQFLFIVLFTNLFYRYVNSCSYLISISTEDEQTQLILCGCRCGCKQ